ncbi:MAG: SDR family NAD(P)-dependent oxidoreductase [Rhodobiaceae bacterium]|nr:SDR family NAD(P)-dependent oxidoreductase [Rhodobiaceae bacterium]MCC0056847.1 SDR family NAD(P)-dependent oxidoreductase [Rhodobiaceae bacterium]
MIVNRTILITGASSGIGLASARTMKERGWRVFATARKPEDLAMLEGMGIEAVYLDYAEPLSIETCAKEVLERTGGTLDALFNNGAYAQPGALEDISADILRHQFEVNFIGWHALTRSLIPAMRAQGHGRIVQCSSVLGLIGMKFRGPYVSTKFALEGYCDVLRMELAPSNIRVCLIEPGPIRSRFVETALGHFRNNIDHDASPHRALYRKRLDTMEGGGAALFKLEPEAVVTKLIHAVESDRPKARYRVTVPAHLFAYVRRLASTNLMDRLLSRISDEGN